MRWRTFCVLSAGGSHAARAAVSIRMSVASIVTRHENTLVVRDAAGARLGFEHAGVET